MNKKDCLIKIHAYIASDGLIGFWNCKETRGNSFRVRKRFSRVRFYNQNEELINDYINAVKKACPHLTYVRYIKRRSEVDLRSQILAKGLLNLGDISTRNWELPQNINKRQKRIWLGTFVDCDGTIQNRKYDRFIAIDSINLRGLKEISKVLENFNITNKIYTIKYKDNISYRLKIFRKENLIRFNKLIDLKHPIKKKKLVEAIRSYKQNV
ncbi:hypothetical protein CMI39_03610 [Candidatus Pacearchaeota archaeon]|jgi:hypothetical protein|nr:hypothetical protein [Candidatus Pacearchaeota archaeon]|tara:strand:+ start:979 stop:1611 length:633 start_codon:yes stop_codon:yes gene_type:complete